MMREEEDHVARRDVEPVRSGRQEPTEDALLPSDAANEDEPHIVRGYN